METEIRTCFETDVGVLFRWYNGADTGGTLGKMWEGVCGMLIKTLTLFQTKRSDFPIPEYQQKMSPLLKITYPIPDFSSKERTKPYRILDPNG